jgi:hypothetical protein
MDNNILIYEDLDQEFDNIADTLFEMKKELLKEY